MRIRHLLAAAGLAAASCLVLPGPAVAAGSEAITAYGVSLDLRADGSMRVEETITYDFAGNARHGIERKITTRQWYDGSHDRSYPLSDIEVGSETAPYDMMLDSAGDATVLRIGDPDTMISGTHTYRIGYTVSAATTRYADHDQIYWNAIGPGWTVPVSAATVQVTGPGEVSTVRCFAGPVGSTTPCDSAEHASGTASFRTARLEPGDALTVVAAYPAGSVTTAQPILVDRVTPIRFLVGNPTVALPLGAVAVGLLVLGTVFARRRKREREASAADLRTGHQPEPPPGVRPVLVNTLLGGRFKPVDQAAMLLDLSARGYLSISPTGAGTWGLVAGRPPDADLRAEERELLDAVFWSGHNTTLGQAGKRMQSSRGRIRRIVYDEATANGWYAKGPSAGRTRAIALGVVMVVLAVPVTLALGFLAHAGLAGLALGLGGILRIAYGALGPVPRTPEGEQVRSRLLAFKTYLAGFDPIRYPPGQREAVLGSLLPYAVVLGLAPQLASAFLAAGVVAGGYVSNPLWWSTFSSDATSAATPSSSSGSGGSGSSGGGGGGGGGGGW